MTPRAPSVASMITALGASILLSGCATTGATAAPAAEDATCPATPSPFSSGAQYLEGYRVFTGPDGDSAVEPYRIDVRHVVLPYNGQTIDIYGLPPSPTRGVQIVSGPANMVLPKHPAPGKEMFILLSGSFTFQTHDFSATMAPGSVLLFEDTDASQGHGGVIGPCGYVSLSIAP